MTSTLKLDVEWATAVSERIRNALCGIAQKFSEPPASNDAWTRAILQAVSDLGSGQRDSSGKGIWVYASKAQNSADGGELLFDLSWLLYQSDRRGSYLLDAPLAMEVEWGNRDDVTDDFQKLVLSRAFLRVMVFSERNKQQVEDCFETLKNFVANFEPGQTTDHYLLCGFNTHDHEFLYRDLPDSYS